MKKILNTRQKDFIKKTLFNTKLFFMRVSLKNKIFSSIYYVFDGSFRREHHSVISGVNQYTINSKNVNIYFLRRNIHRIEKGLIMEKRRNIFASRYIYDTVVEYTKCLEKSKNGQEQLIKWATDVLELYFEAVNIHGNPDITAACNLFNKYKVMNSGKHVPFTRGNTDPAMSYEGLYNLSLQRRSVRWFQEKTVPHEKVDNALKVALQSPSACNRQPFNYRIFDDSEEIKELLKYPLGTTGYTDNIPMLIAVIGELDAYPQERDRHLIYIDSSLSVMAFTYGLEAQGLSSCLINWPDEKRVEDYVYNKLNLKHSERIIMLMAVGYAKEDGLIPYSMKKSLNEVRRYN